MTVQQLTMPVIRLHIEVLGSCGERTMTMSFLTVKNEYVCDCIYLYSQDCAGSEQVLSNVCV